MRRSPRDWPLAAKILTGLAVGVTLGLMLPRPGLHPATDGLVDGAGLIGDLWLSALKMTILPLVFALVATIFIRSHGLGNGGRVARRTIVAVFAFYGLAALTGVVLTSAALSLVPLTDNLAAALRAMGGDVAATPLPFRDMVRSLVPGNIVAAMAGPSLLPVLVFALLFGAALTRVEGDASRSALVNGLTGLADAMFILIGWILVAAPLGVALLVLRTAHTHGTDLLLSLAHYIALYVAVIVLLIVVVALIAVVVDRLSPIAFIRAALPTQAVAFGTQSSLACLPLIIKSCDALGVRRATSQISAPILVTIMRMSSAASAVFITTYAAQAYGLPFGLGAMLLAGIAGALVEMGSVGIPSAATFIAVRAPVLALFGIPLEILAALIVVDTISDVFRTTCNVTADIAAVAVVDRGSPDLPEAATASG